MAVETGSIKKIDDMGVFAVTTIASIFAYVWLYICLIVWTPNIITLSEAIITFGFFFILIVAAYIADKINSIKLKRLEEKEGVDSKSKA